jgi:hypothetical protein
MTRPKDKILTNDDIHVLQDAGSRKPKSMPPGAVCMTPTGSSILRDRIQGKGREVTPDEHPIPVHNESGANGNKTIVDVCQALKLVEDQYNEILVRNTILLGV